MKYAIAMFLVSINVIASEPVCSESVGDVVSTETKEINTKVPKHLKGAVIIVRQADGKESVVPAEKFKVVPRKQQFLVTKTEKSKTMSCTTNKPSKNRVALLGGHGTKSGLGKIKQVGSLVEVESNVGLVGGAQYQRMLNDTLSVGVQGQTNKTGSLILGLDF
jgi:hypothetical protein